MNKNKLRAKMIENGDTQKDLAGALNISLSNLSLRINGKIDFRQSEIDVIRRRYSLTPFELSNIFFADFVSD